MLRKHYMLILILLLVLFFLSGCFAPEEKTKSEKLIGTWKDEDSDYRMYKFLENGRCLINTYELEGTYYINEEGYLVINQTDPFISTEYEYKFNYNNEKLTLIDTETEYGYVFRKQ